MLDGKIKNYYIEECRMNYNADVMYILAYNVHAFIRKDKFELQPWSKLYNEFKGIETTVEKEKSSEEIIEDTLKKIRGK